MKKPRLTDFDPNATAPKLSSPLDDMPTIQKPPSTPPEAEKSSSKKVNKEIEKEPTNERTLQRTNVRSLEQRNKIRHTFDIFSDQLLSLRELAIDREKTFGKRVLIGDLVQEALDMFITKERNKE